jgi:hypothetical protein
MKKSLVRVFGTQFLKKQFLVFYTQLLIYPSSNLKSGDNRCKFNETNKGML